VKRKAGESGYREVVAVLLLLLLLTTEEEWRGREARHSCTKSVENRDMACSKGN